MTNSKPACRQAGKHQITKTQGSTNSKQHGEFFNRIISILFYLEFEF